VKLTRIRLPGDGDSCAPDRSEHEDHEPLHAVSAVRLAVSAVRLTVSAVRLTVSAVRLDASITIRQVPTTLPAQASADAIVHLVHRRVPPQHHNPGSNGVAPPPQAV